MTKPAHGSSLLQARNSHLHQHRHLSRHNRPVVRAPEQPPYPHPRRQVDAESAVTEVVRTVSIFKYVDPAGATIGVQTSYSPPKTQVVDESTGATLDLSYVDTIASTQTSAPGSEPVASQDATTADVLQPSVTASASEPGSTFSAEAQTPLTSPPSTTATVFPSILSATNATSSFSSSLFNTSSLTSSISSTATESSSSDFSVFADSASSFERSRTSSFVKSQTRTSSLSSTPSPTTDGAVGGGSAGPTADDGSTRPTETAAAASNASDDSGPETGVVVGGVVGSIAGLALIVLVLVYVWKWGKRRQGLTLLGDGDAGARSRALPASGGGPGSSGGAMAERSLPFAIPGALASLTGSKRASQKTADSSETGERGFYRISGRKLPSVLHSGGDGYGDPRDSTWSGSSSYRDSQGFFGGPGAAKLAVGAPMRPESGVLIMRPGPARTPITEENSDPFSDPTLIPSPPAPRIGDPLGRSLTSQDGSRGSASRFTENII